VSAEKVYGFSCIEMCWMVSLPLPWISRGMACRWRGEWENWRAK
jgi:hypothetical protein